MLKLIGKLPWFEWVGILMIALAIGSGYTLVKKYNTTIENNVTLETKNEQLDVQVVTEKKVAAVTDQVVFDYTFNREMKIEEALGYQAQTLDEYFAARDKKVPTYEKPEKEKGDVDVTVNGPQPTKTPPTKVVTDNSSPDPDAIAVLVNGMRRTYCGAYRDRDTCPTKDNAHGLQAK